MDAFRSNIVNDVSDKTATILLDTNNEDEYNINNILEKEAELAVHGLHKGVLPYQKQEGGLYPMADMTIWLRSCTYEQVEPLVGKISGIIPRWLDGNFLQNGPGKFYYGANDIFRHMFDGSALIQKFVIRDGQVSYQCRYLRTRSFKKNMEAGKIVVSDFGTNANSFKDTKPSLVTRLASTRGLSDVMSDNVLISINAIGEDYYCCNESPFIVELDTESLKTKNKIDLNQVFGAFSNVAHPHHDDDGNMITVGVKFGLTGPYYSITRVPVKDELSKIKIDLELDAFDDQFDENSRGLSVDRFWMATEVARVKTRWLLNPGYMHSFAMTENYYVLVEQPLSSQHPKDGHECVVPEQGHD